MPRFVYIVGTMWKVWFVESDAQAWAIKHGFSRDDVVRVDTCALTLSGTPEYAGRF